MTAIQVTRKTAAKVPNKVSRNLDFQDLSPTALKLLLYFIAWRQSVGRKDCLQFNWRDLHEHLEGGGRLLNNDHRTVSDAVGQLFNVVVHEVMQDARGVVTRKAYSRLLTSWAQDERTGLIKVYFSNSFEHSLDALARQHGGFTLVPVEDAFRLSNETHLRYLMLVASFAKLSVAAARVMELDKLRAVLNMTAPSYDSWREVRSRLLKHGEALASKTRFRVRIVPVKRNNKVVAVQFNVNIKGEKKCLA